MAILYLCFALRCRHDVFTIAHTIVLHIFYIFLSILYYRLKADYRYDDKYTNLGILFSPTVIIPTPQNITTVDITVFTEMSREPIEFKTDGKCSRMVNDARHSEPS